MKAQKDSAEVQRFMTLFSELRRLAEDDPAGLEERARDNKHLKEICLDLSWAQFVLSRRERARRELFTDPVDPTFIVAWRDYENRFAEPIAGIFLRDLDLDLESGLGGSEKNSDVDWDNATDESELKWSSVNAVIDFAEDRVGSDDDLEADYENTLRNGIGTWRSLEGQEGIDIKKLLQRRELAPFVMIPRHVAGHYGAGEQLTLQAHLGQAQEAFIFGAPLASLALLRSLVEIALTKHYPSSQSNLGRNRGLEQIIREAQSLPEGVDKHRIKAMCDRANDVLHFRTDRWIGIEDIEKETLAFLKMVRLLIEDAPQPTI